MASRSNAPGPLIGAVTTRLTVTVPAGIRGGELVRVAAPDGSYHSVMVPAGLTAGQQFSVELLAGHAEGSSSTELAKLKVCLVHATVGPTSSVCSHLFVCTARRPSSRVDLWPRDVSAD